jgi:hypothetical protein
MKTLNVQDRLEYARCAVAVIRALKITDRTMRYNELARAIGLMSDGHRWEPWHRQQIEAILHIAAAVEKQRWGGEATDIAPLEFERIVTEDGKPGAGVFRNSRIVTE